MKRILKKVSLLLLSAAMIAAAFSTTTYATENHEVSEEKSTESVTEELLEADAASGTMMSNAVEVDLGDTYFKAWTPDTDHLNHFVKFTLSKRGIITVRATKPFDGEGEYGRIKFTIYDESGEPIMGNDSFRAVNSAKGSYEFNCGLAAGTYYMTMLPGFYVRSGTIETYYSVSFIAHDYCEVEPNSDASEATFMNYSRMYTGYFGSDGNDYEEDDYFKFPVLAGHTYRITFDGFGDFEETSTILKLRTNEEVSLGYRLKENIDSNGMNYYDYYAPTSRMAYINFYNYGQSQYEYGIKVSDLTTLSGSHKVTAKVTKPTCMNDGYTTYKCSCGGSYVSNYVSASGKHSYTKQVVEANCTYGGYTIYKCKNCQYSYEGDYTEPNGIHTYDGMTCVDCDYTYEGDISVYRVAGKARYETSLKIADVTKEQLGIEQFDTIIIANGKNFADALAGSYLAKVKTAPIIMANGKNNADIQAYVEENLTADGTVYILGGTGAIPATLESDLSAYYVKRLSGATRFETNIDILEEAGVTNEEIIVATAFQFADSLSASAAGKPILLVNNKKGVLTEEQKTYLGTLGTEKFYIVGGSSAVSENLEEEIGRYGETQRIGGKTRYETSVMIAEEFFDNPESIVLACAKNFPDGLSGGPLAMSMNAPLILTATDKEDVAAAYANGVIDNGYVLGGSILISNSATQNVFALDANTPVPTL